VAAGVRAAADTDCPGSTSHFCRAARAAVGEHFVLPGAARALKRIAEASARISIAAQIAEAIASSPPRRRHAEPGRPVDQYRPPWVDTISQPFAETELHEASAKRPGVAALICLGILGSHELAGLPG